jgi:hypothetical protein
LFSIFSMAPPAISRLVLKIICCTWTLNPTCFCTCRCVFSFAKRGSLRALCVKAFAVACSCPCPCLCLCRCLCLEGAGLQSRSKHPKSSGALALAWPLLLSLLLLLLFYLSFRSAAEESASPCATHTLSSRPKARFCAAVERSLHWPLLLLLFVLAGAFPAEQRALARGKRQPEKGL